MWRSKLYSDVKLVLPLSSTNGAIDQVDEGSDESSAVFSSHKFILASRSPYFAQLLLNRGGFRAGASDKGQIELPSPPFTPASLHFCLGFM